jgi:hypothetical protein
MIQSHRVRALAFAIGLVAAPLAAQHDSRLFEPKETTLEGVRANATAFKNVYVTFTCQFQGIGGVHNPFFTRFTRSEYANFAVWGDNQKIWLKEEYQNPLPGLFVQKNGRDDTLKLLYRLRRYQRIRIVGVVRNVFRDEPWLDVISIEEVGGKVTIPTLAHMHKASDYMAQRKWAQAGTELNQAMTGGLPDFYMGWIHANLGECFMRLGKPDAALSQLSNAKAYLPEVRSISRNIELVAKDPKAAVDTQDGGKVVPKNLEPIWLAVEDSSKASPIRAARPGR